MNDKTKIIGAVIVLLLFLIVGFLLLAGGENTIEGSVNKITLPDNYEIEGDASGSIAKSNDTYVTFIDVMNNAQSEAEFNKAMLANGNKSGYQNISESSANGYKLLEFGGKSSELKNLTYGSSVEWTTYPPVDIKTMVGTSVAVDHFRLVSCVSPNNSTVNYIVIYTDNPNTNLYTTEINGIINSISPIDD